MCFASNFQSGQAQRIEHISGFIQRTARNLLNDDQNDHKTERFWKTLVSFLNPAKLLSLPCIFGCVHNLNG